MKERASFVDVIVVLITLLLGAVIYWTIRSSLNQPSPPTPEASPTPSLTATMPPTIVPTLITAFTPTMVAQPIQLQPTATSVEPALPALTATAQITVFLPPIVTATETPLPTASLTIAPVALPTLPITASPTVSATLPPMPTATAALIPAPIMTVTTVSPPLPTVLAPVAAPPQAAHRYIFPVQPADVATYAAAHHDYPATDIFAPERTTFVAVTDGIIEEVSRIDTWSGTNDQLCTRGGLSVSLVGDDGVRYYGSHLNEVAPGIEPGVRVATGQLLGYIGNSGNARGIAFHLHFGISRPTGPNDCGVRRGEVWPYEYLNRWRIGEAVTPRLLE